MRREKQNELQSNVIIMVASTLLANVAGVQSMRTWSFIVNIMFLEKIMTSDESNSLYGQ